MVESKEFNPSCWEKCVLTLGFNIKSNLKKWSDFQFEVEAEHLAAYELHSIWTAVLKGNVFDTLKDLKEF